jgi:hypothetical protein
MPSNIIGSYDRAVAITKSDTVNIAPPAGRVPPCCDAIYVGGSGDIAVVFSNDQAVTFIGALAGTIIPVAAKRVNSANTSATDLLALFNV